MKKEVYEEWIKINFELNKRLRLLNALEEEKNEMMNGINGNPLTNELKSKINESIKKYEQLLEEIRVLNIRAKELNDECD